MDRRSLLASAGCALPAVVAGCLSGLDGDDSESNDELDLDCERYEGEFGILVVGVPVEVPDDATVIDIEETGILEYDVVEAEMEHARETRSEAEDHISEYDDEDEMSQTGSVQLGNGERYEDVEAALEEYESTEAERFESRWHVTYRGDVYGLSLSSSPLPIPLGDPSADTHSVKIYAVESVPDGADVIDAVGEGLDDGEYLGELLTIAGCSDDLEDIPRGGNRIAKSFVPVERVDDIREALGDRASGGGWYLEYGGEVYELEILIGAESAESVSAT